MNASLQFGQPVENGLLAFVPRSSIDGSAPLTGRPKFMTTEELARLLGVDPSTVRRWRTSKPPQGPPFIKLSERVTMYNVDDVEHWLASKRVAPEAA